ncbi:DUF5675 family protein [Chondrinema litorale]|uniref:DUF5675 family protein n=1 Tax=Chondrinema litorale TaxID=2994555 RepID=UPI002542D2D1|nr:DUF5675 family protein [Chondrinema litorale]UZS00278.1 DUF5675 family protein [Chondrinema litorale]
MKVVLTRLVDNGKQTLGELNIYKDHIKVFSCKTLELPYLDNKQNVSCIPKGTYLVTKRNDGRSKFKYEHLHVLDVPERKYILFHIGNYKDDIQGCILVGSANFDINRDGLLDVTNSRVTFDAMMFALSDIDNFILQIV